VITKTLTLGVAGVSAVLLVQPASAAVPKERDILLPEAKVTVHERAGDPVRLTSYMLSTPNRAYLRARTGSTFTQQKGYWEAVVAPKGARVAQRSRWYDDDGYDSVEITDRGTGDTFTVRTTKDPVEAYDFRWSRDGRKLLGVLDKAPKKQKTVASGFVIVDATTRKSRAVPLKGIPKDASVRFTPDGRYVAADHGKGKKAGIRFYNLDGTVHHTLTGVGSLIDGEDPYSPSGKRLVTWCPTSIKANLCLWDSSGRPRGRITRPTADDIGWWDETHLMSVVRKGKAYRLVVLDLKGRTVRVLADIPASTWKKRELYLTYTR
jgi:dipeptidyl aminopeptidase/acylaminoacyl peptidase